jgi:hypothetical protein
MKELKMSKIYNVIRTLGNNSNPEIDFPKGWEVGHVVFLGHTPDTAKTAGDYIVLYVLVPEKELRGPGRPPKNE